MKNVKISELLFAVDMAVVYLQRNIDILKDELQKVNMKMNISETKTLVISPKHKKYSIILARQQVGQVERSNIWVLGLREMVNWMWKSTKE